VGTIRFSRMAGELALVKESPRMGAGSTHFAAATSLRAWGRNFREIRHQPRSSRDYPLPRASNSEVAGGYATLLQILLVVLFGAVKRACRCDFRRDGPLELATGVEPGARFLGCCFLLG